MYFCKTMVANTFCSEASTANMMEIDNELNIFSKQYKIFATVQQGFADENIPCCDLKINADSITRIALL